MTPKDNKSISNENINNVSISNVELQFMGKPDPAAEQQATIQAENQLGNDTEQSGLDCEDLIDAETMDASDPLSSNMGENGSASRSH